MTLEKLRQECWQYVQKELNEKLNVTVHSHSPGDREKRIGFFYNAPADQNYFGPNSVLHVSLGRAKAQEFADGLLCGMRIMEQVK